MIVDAFSKFMFCEPLQDKKTSSVLAAFKKAHNTMKTNNDPRIQAICTDLGKVRILCQYQIIQTISWNLLQEFVGQLMQTYFDDENINVRHNSSLTHCSIGSKFLLSDFELLFSYVVYVSGTISKSDSKNLLPQ